MLVAKVPWNDSTPAEIGFAKLLRPFSNPNFDKIETSCLLGRAKFGTSLSPLGSSLLFVTATGFPPLSK